MNELTESSSTAEWKLTRPVLSSSQGHGASVGQRIELSSAVGSITIGSGADAEDDPFIAVIRYRVAASRVVYAVDAEPWAIVKGKGGIGLGRTPQPTSLSGDSTEFDLENPKEGRRLLIKLQFTPPRHPPNPNGT